ncbi:MAG: PTS transporter subunit EIIC [Erysipelotrichaceae bacterium]|nr:PTS transporter subunit EIIC [Erysipelotrichaceae bacterium]
MTQTVNTSEQKSFFNRLFGEIQRISGSLMLPIALLPAAGLMMGIGFALTNETLISIAPFFTNGFWSLVARVFQSCSSVIFGNLPLIFAIGVAVGLSDNDGAAGLAALTCFFITHTTISMVLGIDAAAVAEHPYTYTNVLGINSLQCGPFGGIVIGYVAYRIYMRFHKTQLPDYLGFFQGKRLVPIVAAFAGVVLGVGFAYLWPYVQAFLNNTAGALLGSEKPSLIALFVYGFLIKFLVIFGLHHLVYPIYYYQIGTYVTKAGATVVGDLPIYFAQLADKVTPTAGLYAIGAFADCMFVLPAICYAIYKVAKPERKKEVGGAMMAAGFTSFLTGITEPAVFSFAFAAFPIWILNSCTHAIVFPIAAMIGMRGGTTFTGGLIDFTLSNIIPGAPLWWMNLVIGAILAVPTYFITKWYILKHDCKTMGREDDEEDEADVSEVTSDDLPYRIIEACGGAENLVKIDSCFTRLRLVLGDVKKMKKSTLKKLGATDVIEYGDNIQAIFGTKAQLLRDQMREIVKNGTTSIKAEENKTETNETADVSQIVSPMTGKVIPMNEVPDKVFAEKMMGEGFAVELSEGTIVSPVNGTVDSIFETKHAITMLSDDGLAVLLHIGLDTVNMKGEGFTQLVEPGELVKAGQPLMKVDLEKVKEAGYSLVSPVVFPEYKGEVNVTKKQLKAGEKVL